MAKKTTPIVIVDKRSDATTASVANVKGSTEMLYAKVTLETPKNRKRPSSNAYINAINEELDLSLNLKNAVVFKSKNWILEDDDFDKSAPNASDVFGTWFTVSGKKALVVDHIVFITKGLGDQYHAIVVEQQYFREVMLRGKRPSRSESVDSKGRVTTDIAYNFYLTHE